MSTELSVLHRYSDQVKPPSCLTYLQRAVLIWLQWRRTQRAPRQVLPWPQPAQLSHPLLEPITENGDDFNRFDIFEYPSRSAENSLCFKEQKCVVEQFPVQPNEFYLGMAIGLSLKSSSWAQWYRILLAYLFLTKSVRKMERMGWKCSPLTECLPIKIKALLLTLGTTKTKKKKHKWY